ncbi:hypothetical protein ACFVZC_03250 [Streptomyces marokkonensis]|uniref:Uncharacterized protein n=1 Tax=Streptomyces marokkonensis TaxID=324855 RepID=A0ABW6Q037_9ACTN
MWRCDGRALYPCPYGVRLCGKAHATPRLRDVLFDDMVRQTAVGTAEEADEGLPDVVGW